MNISEYKKLVKEISVCKSLPDSSYVHESAFKLLPEELQALISKGEVAAGEFNLIKFHKRTIKLSFLLYPDFLVTPHPVLKRSFSLDYSSGASRVIDYETHSNPPILHRKELFIPESHQNHVLFKALSEAEEKAGLFENKKTIGFKINWEELLKEKGLSFEGHKLVQSHPSKPEESSEELKIDRHKTAISRMDLSKPVKLMLELGVLDKEKTFFDYGCGLGGDVQGLSHLEYEASGWDPNHSPDSSKVNSDVVNLGFVLNVIEEPSERVEVILDAWKYAKEALVISCMVNSQAQYNEVTPYKDGVLTKRNTFQKYYAQRELQSFIEEVLDADAIALSVGVFVVFKDVKQQQSFLSKRERSYINWAEIKANLPFERKERVPALTKLYEENKEIIETYFEHLVQRGRSPIESEYPEIRVFKEKRITPTKLLRLFQEKYDTSVLETTRVKRTEELLVYFAMANFEKKVPLSSLSDDLVADVKSFFGSYTALLSSSKGILFEAGNVLKITMLCEQLEFGNNSPDHFTFHNKLYSELPPLLKIYLQCGLKLAGSIEEYDLVKIHKKSSKVSFMKYKDFATAPLPEMILRVKVNLRNQEVDIFDYEKWHESQLLINKERFLKKGTKASALTIEATELLESLGVMDQFEYGPTKEQFIKLLDYKGIPQDKYFNVEGL